MALLLLETGLFTDDGLLRQTLDGASLDVSNPDQDDTFWDEAVTAILEAEKVITL